MRKKVNTTVDILHNFSRASGLKINYSKSEAMKIGSLILNEDLQPPGEIQKWLDCLVLSYHIMTKSYLI